MDRFQASSQSNGSSKAKGQHHTQWTQQQITSEKATAERVKESSSSTKKKQTVTALCSMETTKLSFPRH